MTGRRGFTLIELLVVIAIIAILAGIMFPVFSRSRAQARKSNCLAHLKQIGMAMIMYCSDNDNVLPILAGKPSVEPTKPVITRELHPYARNPAIFRCPSDSDYFQLEFSSYAWIDLFDGQPIDEPEFLGIDLTDAPYLMDARDEWHGGRGSGFARNCLWVDGHVKFLTTLPPILGP